VARCCPAVRYPRSRLRDSTLPGGWPPSLMPVARAVDAPRVNLLLADDVGLGKTIEAGLVAEELLLRHRGRRIMIVCPAGLTIKWQEEMAEKFGLDFTIIDSDRCAKVRRSYGSAANPFEIYPLRPNCCRPMARPIPVPSTC
jgi:hypothetical protein